MSSNKEDLEVLFQGLTDGVDFDGTAGPLTIFGPRAFPILTGQHGKSRQALAAATRLGEGRIVGFGHDRFVRPKSASQNQFLTNCVNWTSGSSATRKNKIVGVIGFNTELKNWQSSAPFTLQEVDSASLTSDKALQGIDSVVIGKIHNITTKDNVDALKRFVKRGGGLILGATGWAQDGDIKDFISNQISHEAGFGWTKESGVTPIDSESFKPTPTLLQDVHGGRAWHLLLLNGGEVKDTTLNAQLKSVSKLAHDNLPESHPLAQAMTENRAVSYHDDDLNDLLQDLPDGVVPSGSIGLLSVYGPDAFTILPGKFSGDDSRQVVGAGGRYGNGRVVAFGHTSFTGPATPTQHLLLANCARWTANKAGEKFQVGVLGGDESQDWITQNKDKFHCHYFDDSGELTEKLGSLDTLVVKNVHLLDDLTHLQAVKNYIIQGGGLVTSSTGWAQDVDLRTDGFPGNLLLRNVGMVWSKSSSASPIEAGQEGFTSTVEFLRDTHAGYGWILLNWHLTNRVILPDDRLKQIASVVNIAIDSVPNTGPGGFLFGVKSDLEEIGGKESIPTETDPITDALEKLKLKLLVNCVYNAEDAAQNAATCQCHPATKYFPGLPAADAVKLQNHSIKIETTVDAWYSTGLYAPPGQVIKITFPTPPRKTFNLKIGSHSDDISNADKWYRCPLLTFTKSVPIDGTEVSIQNTFGGLIYLQQTESSKTLEVVEITVSGAILAPYFVLDKTTVEEWKEIRKRGAPWGELQSTKLILTLPLRKLIDLDDPVSLMRFWDRVLDAEGDLAGIPIERPYAERIVADVQIGGGYMHSGYPIMIQTDKSIDTAVSLKLLNSDMSWGFYHEIGHNHQKSAWTFALVTEITNNMFALYVYDKVCNLTPAQARPDTFEPNTMKKTIEATVAKGPNYKDWDDDPFLGLLFYYQLKVKYGWDAYKKVFKAYQTLEPKPESEQDKVDTWLVQFSLAVGENLTPLFKSWGIEVTDEAVAKISNLPSTDQTILSLIQ